MTRAAGRVPFFCLFPPYIQRMWWRRRYRRRHSSEKPFLPVCCCCSVDLLLSHAPKLKSFFFFFFFLPHHNSPLPFFIHSASLNARYLIYIHWNISHSSGPRVFSLFLFHLHVAVVTCAGRERGKWWKRLGGYSPRGKLVHREPQQLLNWCLPWPTAQLGSPWCICKKRRRRPVWNRNKSIPSAVGSILH